MSLGSQIAVLFSRGSQLIVRDKYHLIMLVSQPILIGLLINLSQQRPSGLDPIFLFAVVTAIWLGLTNTVREVVRDRPIYVRERLAGVTPEGYLGAKILLFGVVGLLQLLTLILILRYNILLSSGDAQDLRAWPLTYVLLVLWMTYLASMLLGLLASTLANSEETAIAVLPLIILPQLLLTGVATGLNDARDGSFRSLILLIANAKEASRGFGAWLLECISLSTYSRPALSLLQPIRGDQVPVPPAIVRAVDFLHLLLLVLGTGTLLVISFHWREQQWPQQRKKEA